MSVILSYADKNTALIACDGRVVDAENNVISESYKKFRRINDSVILGFAGEVTPCECVANLLTNPEKRELTEILSYEDIHKFIVKYCKTFPPNTLYGFILLGVGKNHKIASTYITSQGSSEITYINDKTVSYQGLYPQELQGKDVFKEYLSICNTPLDAIKSTIKYCAHHSLSVNETIYLDYIQLE